MKWLRILVLLGAVAVVGCAPPSGTAGDENDPATTSDLEPIDEAAEAAAAAETQGEGGGGEAAPATEE